MAAQTLAPHATPSRGEGTYVNFTGEAVDRCIVLSHASPVRCPTTTQTVSWVHDAALAESARVMVFQVRAKFVERTRSESLAVLARASHCCAVHEREVMVVHELGTAWYCQVDPASVVTYSENSCESVTRPSAQVDGVAHVKSLITSPFAK